MLKNYVRNNRTGEVISLEKHKPPALIKGEATIQLMDAKTGAVEMEAHTENVITDFISDMAYMDYFYHRVKDNTNGIYSRSNSEFYNAPFANIVLTDWDGLENSKTRTILGNLVGYCGKTDTNTPSATEKYKGVYNAAESNPGNFKFVYDFPTNTCNGTIKSIFWALDIQNTYRDSYTYENKRANPIKVVVNNTYGNASATKTNGKYLIHVQCYYAYGTNATYASAIIITDYNGNKKLEIQLGTNNYNSCVQYGLNDNYAYVYWYFKSAINLYIINLSDFTYTKTTMDNGSFPSNFWYSSSDQNRAVMCIKDDILYFIDSQTDKTKPRLKKYNPATMSLIEDKEIPLPCSLATNDYNSRFEKLVSVKDGFVLQYYGYYANSDYGWHTFVLTTDFKIIHNCFNESIAGCWIDYYFPHQGGGWYSYAATTDTTSSTIYLYQKSNYPIGAQTLLAAPITKNNQQTLKVTYTFTPQPLDIWNYPVPAV